MNFSRFLIISTFASTFAIFTPAYADDQAQPFVDASRVDLSQLLPPPPPNHSPITLEEIGEMKAIQGSRTSAAAQRASADADESIWRFADAVGDPKFDKAHLPKFSAFFKRVDRTASVVVAPAKVHWARPRPYLLYPDVIKPIVTPASTGSYPSGHTTFGTMAGIILSQMLPERRAQIMARAHEYGWSRVVVGMHYPSDTEAGRISGTVIAGALAHDAEYRREFEDAKAELRKVLGLK